MGRIVVSENVALDGVVEDPTGDEGSTHGGWFSRVGDKDREQWAKVGLEEALAADCLLLGRRSDEYFGTRWSGRSGVWADRLNSLPKYVVSSTLVQPKWSNSTVIKGDVLAGVSKLKWAVNGQIVVYASRQLVHTLIGHDLVDELRLIVYPFVIGGGARLFGEITDTKSLRRLSSTTVGDGLVYLSHEFV